MRVAFLHPDLGLGGAERLVVDAACELRERGHEVVMYTAYHDPKRCFQETVDGTLPVKVHGGWFPRTFGGFGHALCAYIRCILVALAIIRHSRRRQFDVVIVDQVSVVIPVLHWFLNSKVLFYCHHPDLLLARRRPGLHRLYRRPLDWLEEITIGQADKVLVNSLYTAEVFEATFARLHSKKIKPLVLYPACNVITDAQLRKLEKDVGKHLPLGLSFMSKQTTFLSINRFERKKDVELAIRAYHYVLERKGDLQRSPEEVCCRLVIAGGCDQRLQENVEYWAELHELASTLGVAHLVSFLGSFSDEQKSALLLGCQALVYTPSNEHFGIVPLEAMSHGRPVIACNSGGPKETVLHGQTGYLCKPTVKSFGTSMLKILEAEEGRKEMNIKSRQHVIKNFSRSALGEQLDSIVKEMITL